MKFRAYVEPPEPRRGLEIPPDVVEALAGGKRPKVVITLNGHSWRSTVAIMRGRHLLGLSNANRQAAGVITGDEVEIELELDTEPRLVEEPEDLARALNGNPAARAAYDRLPDGRKREHMRAIENAKKPETRARRIERVVATMGTSNSPGDGETMAEAAPRGLDARLRDTLAKLDAEVDLWVATSGPGADVHLIPLSFLWDGSAFLIRPQRIPGLAGGQRAQGT